MPFNLRNLYYRTTLKALVIGMPFLWWRRWIRLLWRTRQYPRIHRTGGDVDRVIRLSYSHTLVFDVDAARRLKRFGTRMEVHRSYARSFNASRKRRVDALRLRLQEIKGRTNITVS